MTLRRMEAAIDRKTIVAYATLEEVEKITGVKIYEGFGFCPKEFMFFDDKRKRVMLYIFINRQDVKEDDNNNNESETTPTEEEEGQYIGSVNDFFKEQQ